MTYRSFNIPQQITSVRLSADGNLSGIYNNGSLNNGIGATLTASSVGALVIDSVNVQLNDRILLSSQTNTYENGIYVVTSIGSPISLWSLQRSDDFQSIEQLKAGQYFSVDAGQVFSGNMYVLTEPLPSSIGGLNNSGIFFFNVTTGGGGGGSGPFLRIANNLSDLSNVETSFANLGLGSGQTLLLSDSDFVGGIYTLTNPCPNYIITSCNTPGNKIRLPSAQGLGSFSLSQGPVISVLNGFQSVEVDDAGGNFLLNLGTPSAWLFELSDKSTSNGIWNISGVVQLVNNKTGIVDVNFQDTYDISSPKSITMVTSGGIELLQNSNTINLGTSIASRPNALFELDSTTQGSIPFPCMTQAQETTLAGSLVSFDRGMFVYNTDFQSLDQWNGTQFLNMLSIGKILSGANISIMNNGDGTISIAATGGPSSVTSGQCNFYIVSNAMATTFSGTGVATPILSANLHVLNENNFNATLVSNTPNINFLTVATRQCLINACFTVRTSSVLTQTYTLYLFIPGSPSVLTAPISSITVSPSGSPGPQEISLTYNLPLTGPSQSLQFWISNDSATTDPVTIVNAVVTVLDTTQFGGFTSTDVLPQGVNNLYLSQNGGASYENVSGSVVSGNIPQFSGTSGLLIDSGSTLSGFITQGESGIYFGAPVSSPFIAPNLLNLFSTVNTGNGAINWYSSADNYPLFQVSPVAHNNIQLNFDSYYNGTNLISSSTGINFQISKTSGSFAIRYGSATAGNVPTMTTALNIDGAGNVSIATAGTNSLVATNGSSALIPASGTYGISISGNAATATSATSAGTATTSLNANNVNTTQVTTNASFYPLMAPSFTNGFQPADLSTNLFFNPSTNILSTVGLNLNGVTASTLAAFDGSKNLVSQVNYGIASFSVVTTSTQSMVISTRYVNNYAGGQAVYSLPSSTGSGKQIELLSLATASTSGWKVNANGTDTIQLDGSVSAAGGSIASTVGSATDCATFTDAVSGKWIVCPALGENLVVT